MRIARAKGAAGQGSMPGSSVDLAAGPPNRRIGLPLEDRGIHLVWNSSPDELSRLSRPDFCSAPAGSAESLTFAWNDRAFGLRCQVTTAFQPGQGGLLSIPGI
jgi:hypothetical protein